MDAIASSGQGPARIAALLLRLSADYTATPLLDLPRLAEHLGVAQILVKDESRRALGSFKSLGGTYAGLRALARSAGIDVAELLTSSSSRSSHPSLLCASDGNHGLAVAAAARFAGAKARIFLHAGVARSRADRITDQGAEVVWIDGTYDDSVDAALAAAQAGGGILVADTTADPADPVVADVIAGYGVMASEIRQQAEVAGYSRPTHLFVQAGCGGLAAAMANGLKKWMAPPAGLFVVEPETAACVTAALNEGRLVRIPGKLETTAGMLSCGEASAVALAILRKDADGAVPVPEDALIEAARLMRQNGGPATTPSGAAGLAGLMAAQARPAGAAAPGRNSRILLIATEADLEQSSGAH